MNAKAPCPCGSGKRYKHCHGPRDRARRRIVLLGAVGAAAVAAAAVMGGPALLARFAPGGRTAAADSALARAARTSSAASTAQVAVVADSVRPDPGRPVLGETGGGGVVRAPIPDVGTITIRPPNSGEVAPGEHPRPWEYDVVHNRYYDPRPGHMHWHSGQPPADTTGNAVAPVVVVQGGGSGPVTVTSTSIKVTPPPAAGSAAKPGAK